MLTTLEPSRPWALMAMISAWPSDRAVTRPWPETVATAVLLEAQVTAWLPSGSWA